MNAVRILGIIGGLGLAGALVWSFYLKSTPLPERTFDRGLPSEATNAKNPVPMKPTDPKNKANPNQETPKTNPEKAAAAGGDAAPAGNAPAPTPSPAAPSAGDKPSTDTGKPKPTTPASE